MSTRLTTGLVRGSYVRIFTPQPNKIKDGSPLEYSMTILVPKTDSVTIEAIKNAIEVELKEKFGDKRPDKLLNPLKDGDEKDEEAYKGHYYLTTWCKEEKPPKVVDARIQPVIDPTECGSGDYYHVSLSFAAFDIPANKGVGVYLGNVQFAKRGESLDSRRTPQADFKVIEDSELPVECEDLLG